MTSQLSFSTPVPHLASFRMNASTAKEQNMGKPSWNCIVRVSEYLKCLQQLPMYNPQQASDKVF